MLSCIISLHFVHVAIWRNALLYADTCVECLLPSVRLAHTGGLAWYMVPCHPGHVPLLLEHTNGASCVHFVWAHPREQNCCKIAICFYCISRYVTFWSHSCATYMIIWNRRFFSLFLHPLYIPFCMVMTKDSTTLFCSHLVAFCTQIGNNTSQSV